jgi:hypothetical protein
MRTWRCRAAGILRRDIWLGALIEGARCNIQSADDFGGLAETAFRGVWGLGANVLRGKGLRVGHAAGLDAVPPGSAGDALASLAANCPEPSQTDSGQNQVPRRK